MATNAGWPAAFVDRKGRTLVIRESEEADAPALLAFMQGVDTETTFLSREPHESPHSEPLERQRISQIKGRTGSLQLVALAGARIVGAIDFQAGTRKRTAHVGEFGLSIRQAYAGAGLGGHLLDELIGWAKSQSQLRKIRLRVQAGNDTAIGLYLRRGFVVEGCLAHEMFIQGAWVDLLSMALWWEPEGVRLVEPPSP